MPSFDNAEFILRLQMFLSHFNLYSSTPKGLGMAKIILTDAHVYYIRRCLHNWTDELCSKIIKAVVPAMASDSKLLIGEMIVPEADPESNAKVSVGDMTAYWMDHAMFTFGGRERTLKDFENLLQGAGLELASVHEAPSGTQAVLEARLKTLV